MELLGLLLAILLGMAALVYLAAFLALFFLQGRLLFAPSRQVWRTPADAHLKHEEIFLNTADGGRIHGWWVPSPDACGTILYFHGNAGNMSHRVETIGRLRSWRFNVFIIDYRGYGNSSGRPSERALYHDAEAAWEFLLNQKKLKPQQIVVQGRSLGSGVAAHLAAQRQPAGVVLEAAFIDIPEIGANLYRWFPVRLLCRHQFPTLKNLERIHCPVLIAHSQEDELIPFYHAERLFEAANEPRFFLELSGGHNECVTAQGGTYERALRSFLHQALSVPERV
jgi:uncharacterized protein